MSSFVLRSREFANYSADFVAGIRLFSEKRYLDAAAAFKKAESNCGHTSWYRIKYISFYGLSILCAGDMEGLKICRNNMEGGHVDADCYANLALAEIKCRFRKRAFQALERGLQLFPHDKRLKLIRRDLDSRQGPVIRYFDRNHWSNRLIGPKMRRAEDTSDVALNDRLYQIGIKSIVSQAESAY